MAHGIETMFSVKERPWHGLGTIVNEAPNMADAIKLAGLDWEVGLKDLYTVTEDEDYFYPDQKVAAYATYRKDSGDLLGVVGERYTPLQNIEAFQFFDPFIQEGLATFETAGSLFSGKKIWVLAKINSPNKEIVRGDEIESYSLLSSSHDGTSAVRIGFTPIRVVCNNTLTMAHGKNSGSKLIKVKHGKNVVMNLESLRETMNLINQSFEATADQYRFLASRQINEDDLRKYVKVVFSQEKEEKTMFSNDLDKETRLVKDIKELFETGRGNTMQGVRGTRWAAYNAVTEYLTHYRGKNLEQRFNSLWFSDGERLNKRALDLALTM